MAFSAHLEPALAAALPVSAEAAWNIVSALPVVTLHAKSRTTETAIVEIDGVGRIVRKRWTWPRRRDRLKGALRTTFAARSPAHREFEALKRLAAPDAGAFAPAPLGFLERREHGVLAACTLLLREVDGATDLATWLASPRASGTRTRVLARLAAGARTMHDRGLADFEMHPRNVIVDASGAVFKVDCAKQRRRSGPASPGDRARDLASLDVGLVRLTTPDERESFFRAYGADAALRAEVERRRSLIDARESRRLPR